MEERICQFINKLLRIKRVNITCPCHPNTGVKWNYSKLSSFVIHRSCYVTAISQSKGHFICQKKTCEYLCIKKIFHLTCCHYAFLAFIQYLQFQLHQWNLSVSVCVCICVCEIKLCYFTSWDLGQVYCLNCYIIITILLSRSNVLKCSCTIYVL